MAPPVESYFDQVIELRDKCRESFDRKDNKGAVKVYKMAVSQLVDFYIPSSIRLLLIHVSLSSLSRLLTLQT